MNRIRCLVTAIEPDDELAVQAAHCVQTLDRGRFDVTLQFGELAAPNCEILVAVIRAQDIDRAQGSIAALRQRQPHLAVLALAVGLPCGAMSTLLAGGVQDFSPAPFNPDEFMIRLHRLAGFIRGARPVAVRAGLATQMDELVGHSDAFNRILAMLPRIAGCDASLLILGETGTGKEVCARAIHYTSARSSRPWVPVNCGALSPELLEAELFGHVRGAFTNAHVTRHGLIHEAQGGSLFLDEIDSMPLVAQCKLLRFLQDKEYRQVGSSATLRADVRIIAASNHDLTKSGATGAFRQDLYFRLNVLNLQLPTLRERSDDIALLATYFLEKLAQREQRPPLTLGAAALKRLIAHHWPGNIRELKHVLERAALTENGPIIQAETLDLPGGSDVPESGPESFHAAKGRIVKDFERRYIERLLAECDGNVTHAARRAQKNRRAFFELMRKHEIRGASTGTDQRAP